jgi:hypothetical protein
MLERTAKAVILVLCPFLGYGFAVSIFGLARELAPGSGTVWFGIGFTLFALVWVVFRGWFTFLCTLEHEITHVLFGLLLLKIPRGFRVTLHDGGHVKLKGSNFLIFLAPYFFPTVSFALAIPVYFVPGVYTLPALSLLGASVAFHLAATWADLRPGQSDLRKSGIMFSMIFLPVANLAAYGSLAAFVTGGAAGIRGFWGSTISNSIDLALWLAAS